MGRIRTIKPEFFKHDELFEAEQEFKLPLRLAFIGLLTCCDREGRFRWRSRQLKLDVLPYDEINFEMILEALAYKKFIVKYEVDGKYYGYIPSWHKHQCINHKESASVIPSVADGCVMRELRVDDACVNRAEFSQGEKEGEGKEEEGKRKGKGNIALQRDEDHALATQEVIVIEIPLNTGEIFQVVETQFQNWQKLYPAIDVLQELRNILGWNLANATKRKTKSGILKHINAWLAKSQNRSGKSYSSRSPPSLYKQNSDVAEDWISDSEKQIFEGEVINEA